MWLIPLLSTLVSLFFALILTEKFMKKRKWSDLLYGLSLYMFALAAFGEFYSSAFRWHEWLYKLYYFPAITLVPIMAAATLYTRFKPIIAHLFFAYVSIMTLLLLIAIIPAEVNHQILSNATLTVGGEAMPDSVRRYSFWLSGIGGIVMILSAIWAWWRSRLLGNLVIVGGALIMSMGGRLATMGWTYFLSLSELFGIVAIFYGVILLEKKTQFMPKIPNIVTRLGNTQAAATANPHIKMKIKPQTQKKPAPSSRPRSKKPKHK